MRKVSDAELTRQIAREGKRWGLHAMKSVFGDVLVGEHIPTLLPLSGFVVLEHVSRDITSINTNYPWRHLLRGRKQKGERSLAHRRELANMRVQLDHEAKLRDMQHELAADIRAADRGRIIIPRPQCP